MKKSKDWRRQEVIDAKLDQFVVQMAGLPAGMSRCQVAAEIGVPADPEFYKKYMDWKRRRDAEADLPTLDIPPEAETALRKILKDAVDDVMASFAHTLRSVAGDVDRTAGLRVKDAERRAAERETYADELLEKWTETEHDLVAAQDRCTVADREVEKLTRALDHLGGRLLEKEDQIKALRSDPATANGATATTAPDVNVAAAIPSSAAAGIDAKGDGAIREGSAHREVGNGRPPAIEPKPGGPERPNQSSTIEDDGPVDHQAEMSLVETDNADKAEAGNDEHD